MIPARFHRLRDRALVAVDKAFSEPVKLAFFTPNRTLDPSRQSVEIEAILRVGGGKTTAIAGVGFSSWHTRINAQKAELHIDRAKYPDLIVRAGDVVRALSRHGQPVFDVVAIDDRGGTRLVLQLGEA